MSNATHHQTPAKPIPFALRLVYTLIPIVTYLVARQFSLPMKSTVIGADPRDWSDTNHVLAVGITPWLIAAVFVDIGSRAIPDWQRWSQQGEIGYAHLRRFVNIFGMVFAVVFAAWITFDLTYVPSVMMAPPEEFYFSSESQASPIIVFGGLIIGSIGFKVLVDSCVPRSFLEKQNWILGVALLLASLVALVRQSSSFAMFVDTQDILRIAVHLLICGMLIAFILLRPTFIWQAKA
jgi:hypothetical protein